MNDFKMVDDRNARKNRIPLSPKIRYEVLRRDGFTCQYCGRTADERELEIDHIVPYSKGGTNDLGNLQVACIECNRGKRADELVANGDGIQVIEKIVYKEVPIKKTDISNESDALGMVKKIIDDVAELDEKSAICKEKGDFGGAKAYLAIAMEQSKARCQSIPCAEIDVNKLTEEHKRDLAEAYVNNKNAMDKLSEWQGWMGANARAAKHASVLLKVEGSV